MKKIAAEHGFDEYVKRWEKPQATAVKAAVVGAGPAGLSAAYFLARAGFSVTVLEREESAGGVTRHVIPGFRFPEGALQADIDFITKHGVDFQFGVKSSQVTVDVLRTAGFNYVFYAVGAEVDNEIPLTGDRSRVRPSLAFLNAYRRDSGSLSLGKQVVVVGGGNTAMDSARAACRVAGVEQVSVVYRRTEKEMPADLEEYRNAIADGVRFLFLTNPEAYEADGRLVCRVMALGEPDASGRCRPVATEATVVLQADTLITAIGEKVDGNLLSWFGVPLNEKGWPAVDSKTLETKVERVYVLGDAQSGPSTVVRCIASARTAVEAAIDKELGPEDSAHDEGCDCGHDHAHDEGCDCGHDHVHDEGCDCGHDHAHDEGCDCGHDHAHDEGCDCGHDHAHDEDEEEDEEETDEELEALEAEENAFFADIRAKKGLIAKPAAASLAVREFAEHEAKRCLECSYICNKCVEVCPNRANAAIDMRYRSDVFSHPFQIVHLDSFCNECGNCATFCPWEGAPYKDKLTLYNRMDDFENSENSGFIVTDDSVLVRIDGDVSKHSVEADGTLDGDLPEEVGAIIEEIISNHSYLLGSVDE
jgi:putative selenate reductase